MRDIIESLTDRDAYFALGASNTTLGATDHETETWALDATRMSVARTATDEDRKRILGWVREGERSAAQNRKAPSLRPFLVRHQSETMRTLVEARNPADAAELHAGLTLEAGVPRGDCYEVRMADGTTTYVNELPALPAKEVADNALLCRDEDCVNCGVPAERLECVDRGAVGIVTNCGCKSQPRPIAGAVRGSGEPVCGACEDARNRELASRREEG